MRNKADMIVQNVCVFIPFFDQMIHRFHELNSYLEKTPFLIFLFLSRHVLTWVHMRFSI